MRSPARSPNAESGRVTGSPSCAATTTASSPSPSPPTSSAPTSSTSTPPSPAPSWRRSSTASARWSSSTTRSSRSCSPQACPGSTRRSGSWPGPTRRSTRMGRLVILTSGTTGTPKGAPRSEAGIDAAISLLSRMPIRAGYRTHIAAPLFHTWGLAHLLLAMLLGTPLVLRRRFDPEEALRAISAERADTFVVIPVMLQRILALPDEVRAAYDLSGLKVVASSGSALPGDLALGWMDAFGDSLYNIYGSTEVAYASVATPADLRAAPTSAGRPPWGTVVKVLDPSAEELPAGESGRVFVGNTL